jgi:hypothetical protein
VLLGIRRLNVLKSSGASPEGASIAGYLRFRRSIGVVISFFYIFSLLSFRLDVMCCLPQRWLLCCIGWLLYLYNRAKAYFEANYPSVFQMETFQDALRVVDMDLLLLLIHPSARWCLEDEHAMKER